MKKRHILHWAMGVLLTPLLGSCAFDELYEIAGRGDGMSFSVEVTQLQEELGSSFRAPRITDTEISGDGMKMYVRRTTEGYVHRHEAKGVATRGTSVSSIDKFVLNSYLVVQCRHLQLLCSQMRISQALAVGNPLSNGRMQVTRWLSMLIMQELLLHRILLLVLGTSALDTDREEREVVELHLLALEQELLGALDCVAEHTEDGALRIGAVVTVHVLGESLEVEGFVTCRPGEPQTLEIALGLPLIKIITNHTIMMC